MIWGIMIAGCIDKPAVNQSTGTPPLTPSVSPSTPIAIQSISQPAVTTQPVPVVYKKSTYGEAPTVVEANNQFAFEMFDYLRQDPQNPSGNIFFSPFSMSSALAMTYEGANGTTADEIAGVFHFPRDNSIRPQQFKEINAEINNKDPGYTLRSANALWVETTYPFRTGYVQTIKSFYDANATNLDFKNSPENSRLTINEWVENKTDGKIAELFPLGSINKETRLVITNAVYFNGFWKYPFFTSSTQSAKFNISPDRTTDVNMMAETNYSLQFNYAATDRLQIVEMPYKNSTGRELSMLVILPKGNNLTAVEDTLDAKNFSVLRKSLQSKLVFIYLPKFKMETQYKMNSTLQNMGMPTAFSEHADFSGMDWTNNLSISEILHKTFIEVDEKGTKAAAVTFVRSDMEHSGYVEYPEPVIFLADHPFLFIIQDRETGNILFIGRVMNPNA